MLILSASICHAQSNHYKQLTVEDGLPSNCVYQCIIDSKGYLWACTERGVVKYNGRHFQVFTESDGLPTNKIWFLHEDDLGRIWTVNHKSLAYYIRNDSVHHEPKLDSIHPVAHYILYPNSGIGILMADNFLLLDSNKVKTRTDLVDEDFRKRITNTFIPLSSRMDVYDIEYIVSKNYERGRFRDFFYRHMGNKSFGLMRYGSSYIVTNLVDQTIMHLYLQDTILSKLPDSVRLSHVPLNHDSIMTLDHIDGSITYDMNNHVFLSSILIPKEFRVNRCIQHNGLNYCGTKSSGIIISSNQGELTSFKRKSKTTDAICISNNIKTTISNGEIYIGNKAIPIKRRQSNSLNTYILPSKDTCYGLNSNIIYKIYGNQYDTFNLSNSNFSKVKYENALSNYPVPKLLHGFRDIRINNDQFLRTGGVLSIYGNYKQGNLEILNQKSPPHIVCFRDTIFAFIEQAVMYIHHDTIIKRSTNFIPSDANRYFDRVNGFAEIIPKSGIRIYNGFQLNQTIPFKEPIDFVKTIGDILFIWAKGNLFLIECSTADIKEYPIGSMIPGVSISDIEFNNDSIFIVSNNELLKIDTNSIQYPKPDFHLTLTRNDLGFNNHLFKWSCNSLHCLGQVHFEYRLLPTDTTWKSTNNSDLQLLSLSPKHYQFQLKVKDSIGNTSETQNISFSILPPWYKSLWFIIPSLLTIFLLTFIIIQRRAKSKLIAQEEKSAMEKKFASLQIEALRSQMNPHFIFNALAAIQNYIRQSKKEEADDYLTKFALLIRKFLDYSQQNTILINNEINLIESYVEIENLRFNSEIDFKLHIHHEVDRLEKIPSLLIQPFIENSIHHGLFHKEGEKKLDISFEQINDILIITIKDNGIGFEASKNVRFGPIENKVSKGIKMLEDRFTTINSTGDFHVKYTSESSSNTTDTGTTVTIKIEQL